MWPARTSPPSRTTRGSHRRGAAAAGCRGELRPAFVHGGVERGPGLGGLVLIDEERDPAGEVGVLLRGDGRVAARGVLQAGRGHRVDPAGPGDRPHDEVLPLERSGAFELLDGEVGPRGGVRRVLEADEDPDRSQGLAAGAERPERVGRHGTGGEQPALGAQRRPRYEGPAASGHRRGLGGEQAGGRCGVGLGVLRVEEPHDPEAEDGHDHADDDDRERAAGHEVPDEARPAAGELLVDADHRQADQPPDEDDHGHEHQGHDPERHGVAETEDLVRADHPSLAVLPAQPHDGPHHGGDDREDDHGDQRPGSRGQEGVAPSGSRPRPVPDLADEGAHAPADGEGHRADDSLDGPRARQQRRDQGGPPEPGADRDGDEPGLGPEHLTRSSGRRPDAHRRSVEGVGVCHDPPFPRPSRGYRGVGRRYLRLLM